LERVLLRDVVEDDLPTLFLQQLDREATEMAAFPSRDQDAFNAHWAKVLANPAGAKKAILLGGSVAGYLVSWDAPGERLIGYWLGREYWGKGVATRALQMFLAEVAQRPLRARVAKRNVASIRVLEKCGFRAIGEEEILVNGERVEELVFALEAA
jgi:RimJ/RimL family protein N-acetyltransferase